MKTRFISIANREWTINYAKIYTYPTYILISFQFLEIDCILQKLSYDIIKGFVGL